MADDPEAMDLLAGYLAQALMTTSCATHRKIVIGGGVDDSPHRRSRAKVLEILNSYINHAQDGQHR